MSEYVSTKSKFNTHMLAKISVLSALAFMIMLFEVPVPFAPPFLEIDLSEVVVLIGGFALGPWAAVCIEGLKIALNLLFNGSTTMGVGELSNFLIGCSLVLPAILIYKKAKTRKNALLGLLVGIVCMTIAGALLNYFIVFPAYAFFMQPYLTMDTLIGMGHSINTNINGLFALIMFCVVPFNLLKGTVVSCIVFISYKRISPLLKRHS